MMYILKSCVVYLAGFEIIQTLFCLSVFSISFSMGKYSCMKTLNVGLFDFVVV